MYGALGTAWDSMPPMRRSYKASYNRPLVTRAARAINAPLGAEYPMLRFLEKSGFHVTYASGLDMHVRGRAILSRHRAFVSVGHDEYWSGSAARPRPTRHVRCGGALRGVAWCCATELAAHQVVGFEACMADRSAKRWRPPETTACTLASSRATRSSGE